MIVGIAINPLKQPIFSYEERKDLLKTIVCKDPKKRCKVKVKKVEGLLADFIEENNIDF